MEKKQLLIYSYYFPPYENANTNVSIPILLELLKNYGIDVFTIDPFGKLPIVDEYKGINIYRHKLTFLEHKRIQIFSIYKKSFDDLTAPYLPLKHIIWRFFHRILNRKMLDKIICEYPIHKELLDMVKKKQYYAIITLSAPIDTQMEVLNMFYQGMLGRMKWYAYFMDPHATFIGLREFFDQLIIAEMDIYKNATAVFTTQEIFEDNKSNPLKKYLYKTYPLSYANLVKFNASERPTYLSRSKITCAYLGSLFCNTVRNPEYFYQTINHCDKTYEFHIVCNCMDTHNRILKEKYLDGKPNVKWHENLSMEECRAIMSHADVLINLGNRCMNQTPSKIFDYISAGKPIVNIHPFPQDTAYKYLEKYPLTLSILEQKTFSIEDLKRFMAFCNSNRGRSLSYNEVLDLYPTLTAASVAENVEHIIDN